MYQRIRLGRGRQGGVSRSVCLGGLYLITNRYPSPKGSKDLSALAAEGCLKAGTADTASFEPSFLFPPGHRVTSVSSVPYYPFRIFCVPRSRSVFFCFSLSLFSSTLLRPSNTLSVSSHVPNSSAYSSVA